MKYPKSLEDLYDVTVCIDNAIDRPALFVFQNTIREPIRLL